VKDFENKNHSSNINISSNDNSNNKIPTKKILLVEDDLITQDVIRFFLKDLYIVHVAHNAESAMEFVHSNKYIAILMDINLGKGKSGIDITQDIRKISGYENTPIIAETAFAMRGDKEEFLAAGCDYYISKPFSKEDIRNILLSIDVEQPK
jgi:CheY-like chemotaxis protein